MKIVTVNAEEVMLDGAKSLYDAVKVVLGPKSRNALIRTYEGFVVTHDGATVVDAIQPTDDTIYGVELIKQATSRMNDKAGDGTTTVSILSYHLLKSVLQLVDNGENSLVLRRKLPAIADKIAEEIKKRTVTVSPESLVDIATISAADKEIGSLVSEVVNYTGKDGLVTTERSSSTKTTFVKHDGCRINFGHASNFFLKDEKDKEVKLEQPKILVVKGKITSFHDLLPLLGQMSEKSLNTVAIFAEEISVETIANLVANNSKGLLSTVAVEVLPYSTLQLKDIAALTGATVVDRAVGLDLKTASLDVLGSAEKVITTDKESRIIGGVDITDYKKAIKKEEKAEQRIAILDGKAAIIYVGGLNETEIVEKEHRIIDAIYASEAALRGGIVAGGGTTLYDVSKTLGESTLEHAVAEALQMPYKILLENSGIEFVEPTDRGIDVLTGKQVDMLNAGIVDPAEITLGAVENAINVAGQAITTGAIIDTTTSES